MPTAKQQELYNLLEGYCDIAVYMHCAGRLGDLGAKQNDGYITLAIEPKPLPNTNAVGISADNSTSFYTRDEELIASLSSLRYPSEPTGEPLKHKFQPLSVDQIRAREADFRQLVLDSLRRVEERRGNRRGAK